MSKPPRIVVVTVTPDGETPMVPGVFGPYADFLEASDALSLIHGVEMPVGVTLGVSQHPLEGPSGLEQRLAKFGVPSTPSA